MAAQQVPDEAGATRDTGSSTGSGSRNGSGSGSEVHTRVDTLPAEALQLLHAAGQLDFQSSAAWFENFLQHVDSRPAQPQFHVWQEQGRVVALLPLLVNRNAGSATALGNYYTTRFAPLLAAQAEDADANANANADADADANTAALTGLFRDLLQREPQLHTLNLGPLEAGSADETLLRTALCGAGCAVFHLHAFQNWLLPVRQDWASYLAARDGRLRTTLSRMGRRFITQGGTLQLLPKGAAAGELETAIAAYQSVYAASWKQAEPHPQFMPGLIRAAAAAGALRMAVAWLKDKPVAAQVWVVSGGRADIYKLAHDEAHKETSPGTLLTSLLMQHVFEADGVHTVDYLSGDDGYKRLWMSEVRERRQLLAFKLRSVTGLALAVRQWGVLAVSAVKA